MRPRHRLREGLASLASLAAISFGIPFVLWKIAAWPLPRGVPSVDRVREAFSSNDVPDSVVIKAVALIGWCAWFVLALCIAFEVMAWIHGHAARNVLGAGAVQPSVRKLVATAALLLGSSTLHTPTGAGPPALAVAAVTAEVRPIAITSEAPPPAPPSAPVQAQPPAAAPKYVVQRRDTLWALAESHLGNPLRWQRDLTVARNGPA